MTDAPTPILMVGPHPDRVKGGISSWVRNILSSEMVKEYSIDYVATKVDDSKMVKMGWAVRAIFIFFWKIWTSKAKLVHIHGSHYASFYRKMVFILLAKIGRKKILFHCHGSRFDQFYHQGPNWQKILIRRILSFCNRVIILSPYWETFFSEFLDSSRLVILENAIPLNAYQSVSVEERKKSNGPVILFAGEVGERKGIYDLLSVIPDLVRQVPRITLLLAGNGELDKVRFVAESLNIETHLQLTGWVPAEKMTQFYLQADLFVLPSYHEGMPMAILEAMACGLPVVSTRVGGIAELIKEGENGFLINPGDRQALLEALLVLLADPVLRENMALKNIQKVKDQYDMPGYLKKLKGLYREILEEKSCLKP